MEIGFSPQATGVLGTAVMMPDFQDWNTPAAHAQTANDKNGIPTESTAQAEAESVSYLQHKASDFLAALSSGNTSQAVYVLGYAIHTIQDYAAHRGMTNFDHSYLSDHNNNPDEDPARIALAGQWTSDFLLAVKSHMSPCAWQRIRNLTSIKSTTGPSLARFTTPGDIHYYKRQ